MSLGGTSGFSSASFSDFSLAGLFRLFQEPGILPKMLPRFETFSLGFSSVGVAVTAGAAGRVSTGSSFLSSTGAPVARSAIAG